MYKFVQSFYSIILQVTMIPMRNRKKTLEVTIEEMRNFSFAYIEKYAPSKQQLRTYLLKKYLRSSIPNVKKQDIT